MSLGQFLFRDSFKERLSQKKKEILISQKQTAQSKSAMPTDLRKNITSNFNAIQEESFASNSNNSNMSTENNMAKDYEKNQEYKFDRLP